MRRSVLVLFVVLTSSSAQSASFQGLDALPGGSFSSVPFGVSDDGFTIVGNSSSTQIREAFRWDADNGIQGLGDLPGGQSRSFANEASADGSVIVGSSNSALGSEAFRWDSTNGMQGLGDFAGLGFNSTAYGTSADGSVIVGRGQSALGNEAFRWDAINGMQGLGDLEGGGFDSWARAISADGSVIVGHGASDTAASASFRWEASGGMETLGDLEGGGVESWAYGTSADGSVIVGNGQSALGNEAFRWDAVNGMQGLGDLSGGSFGSGAQGVSADGSIIVGSSQSASGSEAFIWDATNGMQELDVVLTALGVDLTGWTLSEARDISADGRTIIGHGINPSGLTEAWVAVISAPDTDSDGVPNSEDNCPDVANADQADTDFDDVGDACNDGDDSDGDEWSDVLDNCPVTPNMDQADSDLDGVGNACNDADDSDSDEWSDALDNCPTVANGDQADTDLDGFGDACDLFPNDPDNGLAQCLTDLATCSSDFSSCDTNLTTCSTDLGTAQADLIQCAADEAVLLQSLDNCQTSPPFVGDVNWDGEVNLLDSVLLRRQLAGLPIEPPSPAVTALKLRLTDTDRWVKTVENGDIFSLSLAGTCMAIHAEVNESTDSVRYDWTPPGGTEILAHLWDDHRPFCWADDNGWTFFTEIPDCDCSPEMAQLGDHQLVITPCSADVDFGLGETCVGNGGLEGPATSVNFTIEP